VKKTEYTKKTKEKEKVKKVTFSHPKSIRQLFGRPLTLFQNKFPFHINDGADGATGGKMCWLKILKAVFFFIFFSG
jgi:hypothetical protein